MKDANSDTVSETRLKNQPEAHQKKKSNEREDPDEAALEWFLSPPKTCTLMDPNHPSVMEDDNPTIAAAMVSKKADDHQIQERQRCNFRGEGDFDEALEWFLSPPKTCKLMEPLKEKMPLTPVAVDGSVLRSRRAGETTLKKELWTKFQAVSMGRISYRDSMLQKGGKKGFMDMLEEAT